MPLGPIARGGHVFLPQSNVSVRIQQVQLEQVPSTFSIHAELQVRITRIPESQLLTLVADSRQ